MLHPAFENERHAQTLIAAVAAAWGMVLADGTLWMAQREENLNCRGTSSAKSCSSALLEDSEQTGSIAS